MAEIARKHHFIPEFILAGFTPSGTKNDMLWVTDRDERRGFHARPRNVGFQKDFYRVDVEGVPEDQVEKIIGWFEGYAAPAVKHVLDRHSMPLRPELDHLMELIGLLFIRVPAARKRVDRALDRLLKDTFLPRLVDQKVLHTTSADHFTMGLDREWLLGQMLQASVPAQKMVFERDWTVLLAEVDAGNFICSDAPVCLSWTDTDRQDRAPRLDERGTDLTVPLGRQAALRGRYETGQAAVVCCDRKKVAYVNIGTISSGDRFLYSSGKDFPWERADGSIGMGPPYR